MHAYAPAMLYLQPEKMLRKAEYTAKMLAGSRMYARDGMCIDAKRGCGRNNLAFEPV